ncbi:MFS transporter [Streptomyces antarcticus]|uniref:MFS transporter n=1 Tax=Streptomyces antarcticus TaxID=2996458 RepID=UPI00226E683B|nr:MULTISPECIES: MFS transporter [unclassified Streptomyces]MCY0947747.1 MFS transporter [Streptomyces sp. H34-AA3]MCZ4088070.1 MFS transporter [Streptomyces sp. H34-S5]
MQLGSDPAYRGRVMALYTLVFQGTTPFGALLIGWLSERLGARSGLLAGGAATVLAALVVLALHLRGTGRREPDAPAGAREASDAVSP